MKAVFDTNILIDYLNGRAEAASELRRYRHLLISRIAWMEVLVGADTDDETSAARSVLDLFKVLELDERIAREAIALRKRNRMRLSDAVVLATARVEGCVLVTRNTRDFKADWVDVRVPYA